MLNVSYLVLQICKDRSTICYKLSERAKCKYFTNIHEVLKNQRHALLSNNDAKHFKYRVILLRIACYTIHLFTLFFYRILYI